MEEIARRPTTRAGLRDDDGYDQMSPWRTAGEWNGSSLIICGTEILRRRTTHRVRREKLKDVDKLRA